MQAVLYAIACDNEYQYLADEVHLHHPATLIALARAALSRGEPDAKWQLADELGHLLDAGGAANQLLLILARDEHEYVRRRALGALARVGSPASGRRAAQTSTGQGDDPDEATESRMGR